MEQSKLPEKSMLLRSKIIILVLLLFIFGGGGIVAFKFYNFTQHNPRFCVSCHLMKAAYDAWAASEHSDLTCHDCHHLTIPEQNRLLINFILHRPKTVPERHGKVIVPWKYCIQCHWEKNEKHSTAKLINRSSMHAKHVFMEQLECVKCHGYITHRFTAEEKFCIKCHQGKIVHGIGMEKLACLNCHTDRTRDLRPGPKKCLFCHGSKDIRKELIADATLDVTHFKPKARTIKKAIKIDRPENAPMQFFCYECHRPHETARPDWGNCFGCHQNIIDVGKHKTHVEVIGMECKRCHKPHSWRVTPKQAKKDCVICHVYKEPKSFLSS
jgi:nitrate/TMAO reductase-like tetraheme cytochrome c subunit